jgi:hypothetical protein
VEDFERLLSVQPGSGLANAVRKLSYMVPIFYPRGNCTLGDNLHSADGRHAEISRFEELFNKIHAETVDLEQQLYQRAHGVGHVVAQSHRSRPSTEQLRTWIRRSKENEKIIKEAMVKADTQKRIIDANVDARALLHAFRAFENLEQIRLMRVQDGVDARWNNFLNSRPALAIEFMRSSQWTLACEHASRTLTSAYLDSGCPAKINRLSSRLIDPPMPFLLTHNSHVAISKIASRLNSLELHFDAMTNLDDMMLQLSPSLQIVFSEAFGLQGLHIGFATLVSIPLETVFHNVQWKDLRYLGFHSWLLSSAEIVHILRRHRKTLQSVRLRRVRLTEGSRWEEILKVLRLELNLKWISLREIGYTARPEEAPGGMHFGQNQPFNPTIDHQAVDEDGNDNQGQYQGGLTYDSDTSDLEPDSRISIGDRAMIHHSTPASDNHHSTEEPPCECGNGYSWGDLRDSGLGDIQRSQWKRWERWVTNDCPIHDPQATSVE